MSLCHRHGQEMASHHCILFYSLLILVLDDDECIRPQPRRQAYGDLHFSRARVQVTPSRTISLRRAVLCLCAEAGRITKLNAIFETNGESLFRALG